MSLLSSSILCQLSLRKRTKMNRRTFISATLTIPGAAAASPAIPRLLNRIRSRHFILQTMHDPAVRALHILAKRDKSPRLAQLIIRAPEYTNYTDQFEKNDWIADNNILWTQISTAPPLLNATFSISCWSKNSESTIHTNSRLNQLTSTFTMEHTTGNTHHRKFKCQNPAK